jgi:DNA-binding transcriptional LysR family regulator
VRAISEGYGDIGIVADLVDPAEGLEVLPCAEDRLVLVVLRRHALGRFREVAFRDSPEYDFVGR